MIKEQDISKKDCKLFQKHASQHQNQSKSRSSLKFRINYAELVLDDICVWCGKDSHLPD